MAYNVVGFKFQAKQTGDTLAGLFWNVGVVEVGISKSVIIFIPIASKNSRDTRILFD
jgi:hypothetical protein